VRLLNQQAIVFAQKLGYQGATEDMGKTSLPSVEVRTQGITSRQTRQQGRTKSKFAFSLRLLKRFSVADNWTKLPPQLFPLWGKVNSVGIKWKGGCWEKPKFPTWAKDKSQ
jgi:hypothetical protein